MAKKFSLLIAAAAILAFAVPALANAAPQVTSSKEVTAKVGSTITGVSTDTETTGTPLGTLKCGEVMVAGVLKKNTGTEVEATDDETAGANTTSNCTVEGQALTIEKPTLTKLIATSSTKTVALSFTAKAKTVVCEYQGTVPFTYTPGTGSIHIAGKLKDPARATCKEPEIHGDFALSISGTPVILD